MKTGPWSDEERETLKRLAAEGNTSYQIAEAMKRPRGSVCWQAAKMKVQDYLLSENRFKMLTKSKPEDAKRYFEQAQHNAESRWQLYSYMAARKSNGAATPAPAPTTVANGNGN